MWGGGLKTFYTPQKLLVCGRSKNIFYNPPKYCKTESAKFHEILTSVWGSKVKSKSGHGCFDIQPKYRLIPMYI